MPKVEGTRKQLAAKLLERIKRGPSFSLIAPPYTSPEVQYRCWAESWVVKDLIRLIPELRKERGLK